MFIEGIGISGYRSFGPEMQRIGPFSKINLIIGPNNSGKSNFLKFLYNHYAYIAQGKKLKLDSIDVHIGNNVEINYEIGFTIDGMVYQQLMDRLNSGKRNLQGVINNIQAILNSEPFTHGSSIVWFPCVTLKDYPDVSMDMVQMFQKLYPKDVWFQIWTTLTGSRGGGLLEHWIPDILKRLIPVGLNDPTVSLIPAIREIVVGDGKSSDELMSGKGIVKQLARLEKPRHDQQHLKQQFDKINHFLKTVTGNQTARIEIPSEQDIIQVDMDGRVLPLSSLGTGIHEVIILASAATIIENQIICIEEPEIHLHPLLQKQLLQYLAENTTNQYFIATHSAHMLDVSDVSIFRIRLEEGKSIVDLAITDSEKSMICDELGYKASDLLQANCIIWVEGPSDRIYLNHWIHSKDHKLVEGVHYSIMFYGGRLLSHLTAEEENVEDFIALKRLNRHMGIVIDSDKRSPEDKINDTKKRITAEFEKDSDFVWITQGKEIENYLTTDLIDGALKGLYGDDIKIRKYSEYNNCIEYKRDGNTKYKTADKIKLANRIVNMDADFSVLDLDVKIDALIQYIREANGI